MKLSWGIKPQDVVVVLKVLARTNKPWRHLDFAYELGMSQSEVSSALERARRVGFLDGSKRKVFKSAFFEFLKYGMKYVFPAEPGRLVRGVPTAHSAAPLAEKIISNDNDQYVWPYSEGDMRGQAIEPLYPTVPEAAKKDPELHKLLALVDAIRVGRVREQKLAQDELWLWMKRAEGAPLP